MKKTLKILGYLLLLLIVLISGFLIYVKTALPDVGAIVYFRLSSNYQSHCK